MGLNRIVGFLCGIAFGVLVTACASAVFPYHYYGLDLKGGKLLGPSPDQDLLLENCDATPSDASPCVAMMSPAFLELKKDYLDTKNQLISCQQQLAAK